MKRINLNMENATIDEVYTAMNASPTKKGFIRLQAIYFLMKGYDKQMVYEGALSTLRTLYRWIERYNLGGIDALIEKPGCGRPKLINENQSKKIIGYLENPEKLERNNWTLCSLHGYLKEEIDIQCSYTTFVRKVHKLGYVLKFPRPCSPLQDEQKRLAYKSNLDKWKQAGHEIWYIDETGVEGDPRPRRKWVKKGSNPTIPYYGTHLRETAIGGVCPGTGQFESIQTPFCNREIFQLFLDYLSTVVDKKKVLLILDNASWHKSKKLNWYGMKHEYLPPYSPDFNPIERIWLLLKARYFSDWIAKIPDELTDRITEGLKSFINNKNDVKSIC